MTIDELQRVGEVLSSADVPLFESQDDGDSMSLADRVKYLVSERDMARRESVRLTALINTPRTDDFFEAVRIEAAHQIERWGVEHDAGKRAEDWIALVTYLLGKATKAHYSNDGAKLLHHVITLAAVALNWHRNVTGVSTAMRPGVNWQDRKCSPGFICIHDVTCPGASR